MEIIKKALKFKILSAIVFLAVQFFLFLNNIFANGELFPLIFQTHDVKATALGGNAGAIQSFGANLLTNPSLLTLNTHYSITGIFTKMEFEREKNFFSFIIDNPITDIACSIIQTKINNIEQRDDTGKLVNLFNTHTSLFTISLAKKIKNFSAGLNVSILNHSLLDLSAKGLLIDIGFFKNIKHFRLGLSIKNFLSSIIFSNASYSFKEVPSKIYTISIAYALKKYLNLYLESQFSKLQTKNSVGLEYQLKDRFALRAGLNSGGLTIGAGFTAKNFVLDYAIYKNSLGYNHKIATTFLFSTDKKRKISRALSYYRNALKLIKQKQNRKALAYLRVALKCKPSFKIRKKILSLINTL